MNTGYRHLNCLHPINQGTEVNRDSALSLKRHEGAFQRWGESEFGHVLCAPVEETELFPATFLKKLGEKHPSGPPL